MLKKLNVNLKKNSYPIFYKRGLFNEAFFCDYIKKIASCFVIITHESIKELVAKKIHLMLKKENVQKIKLLTIKDGEENKTRKTKEYLEDEMLKENFLKDTLIIAVGGGIISDISGFIAKTYMRGVPYITVPTTLLAMVDASIGGKTAVNTPYGKNTIGAFNHPKAVFLDFEVLKTLSKDELNNGLSEIIKHALIGDEKLFLKLLENQEITDEMIIENIKIKKTIVESDEKEENIRKTLNFAHTISHGIEAALGYKISHGKALFWGILAESFISYKMNLLSMREYEKIQSFLRNKNLLNNISNLSISKVMDHLKLDKKNVFGKNRFTLLKKIGQSVYNIQVKENFIIKSLDHALGGKLC